MGASVRAEVVLRLVAQRMVAAAELLEPSIEVRLPHEPTPDPDQHPRWWRLTRVSVSPMSRRRSADDTDMHDVSVSVQVGVSVAVLAPPGDGVADPLAVEAAGDGLRSALSLETLIDDPLTHVVELDDAAFDAVSLVDEQVAIRTGVMTVAGRVRVVV
ncbi:MAG: hypothetical protein AAGI53_09495 [Planctomycetota bacterium]